MTELQMTSPGTPGLRLGRLGLRGLGLAGNDRVQGAPKGWNLVGTFQSQLCSKATAWFRAAR